LWLIPWSCTAAAHAQESPQAESTVQDAERLYYEGVSAVEEGDYRAALRAFRASYDLHPAADALYNVGICLQALDDAPGAANAFREYLDRFGGGLSEQDRAEIDSYLADLLPQVGRLAIRSPESGAAVAIDGTEIGSTPLGEWFAVDAGRHAVVVTKDGFSPVSTVVRVGAGEVVLVDAALASRVAGGPSPMPAPPGAEEGSGGMGPWFWVCTGLAGAATVTLAVTGGLTLKYKDDYMAGGGTDRGLYDTAFALRTTTDVFLGVALAAAAAAVLVLVLDGSEEPAEEGGAGAPTALLAPSGLLVWW
jgi:tetratricopeptide (TPR) repeat protein